MEEKIYELLNTLHQWGICNTEYGFRKNAKKEMFYKETDGLREQPCLYIRRTTGNSERVDRIPVDWSTADHICVVDDHLMYYIWYFTLNNDKK